MMGLHIAYDVFSIIKGDTKCTFAPGTSSPVKAMESEWPLYGLRKENERMNPKLIS